MEGLRKPYAWPWPKRMTSLIHTLKSLSPDLAFFQEVGPKTLERMKEALPEHGVVAHTSRIHEGHASMGEHCPVFYKRARFDCEEDGIFWLSETPDIPSKSFAYEHPQGCSWARLRCKETGEGLLAASTHLGHGGMTRQASLQLLANRLPELAVGAPILLGGDFNTTPGDARFLALTEAGFQRTHSPRSLHFFGVPLASLDAIFFTAPFQVQASQVITGRKGAVHASDHYGLLARLSSS